jgi:hypothetical protein
MNIGKATLTAKNLHRKKEPHRTRSLVISIIF